MTRPMASHHRRPARRLPTVLSVILPILFLAACSTGTATSSAPSPTAPTITDAWVRPPLGPDRPAAGYLVITGAPDHTDVLQGVSSPAAGSVEIHETTADASGMMAMHPIEELPVPAGSTVTLQPGGYHLMLMDPTGELGIGDTVELVLEFESAGRVTVRAPVREG